jgi:hypothetical protein
MKARTGTTRQNDSFHGAAEPRSASARCNTNDACAAARPQPETVTASEHATRSSVCNLSVLGNETSGTASATTRIRRSGTVSSDAAIPGLSPVICSPHQLGASDALGMGAPVANRHYCERTGDESGVPHGLPLPPNNLSPAQNGFTSFRDPVSACAEITQLQVHLHAPRCRFRWLLLLRE